MKRFTRQLSQRGFTLVEMMIVVAIIGILAGIAGVAYMRYIKRAKIGKLKQYAMEVSNDQEQYKSQNSHYLGTSNSPITYDETTASPKWKLLLGFDKKGLKNEGITIKTEAGKPNETCSICTATSPTFDTIWYAVAVSQDLNSSVSKNTTVLYYTGIPEPMVINEGD